MQDVLNPELETMTMRRITQRDLEGAVARINGEVNGYTTANPNDLTKEARVGLFYIQGAYGGWKLERIENAAGGCSDVFGSGFVSRRDLYNMLFAMLDGIRIAQATVDKWHGNAVKGTA